MNFDADEFWMRRALAEAERGRGWVEPNPLVGAVVVRDGQEIAVGHHTRFGGPHAEVEALTRAGVRARGATLYVTLEPCCHHGKTPPCTDAILAAGVTRVVAALRDPFPRVSGGGFAQLRDAGIPVEEALLAEEARRQNAPYLKRLATGQPYVIAKWAMTLDGKTATRSGDSRWISNPRSRGLVHDLRGRVDAIAVGVGTVLADDPQLTARPPGPRRAARVVLDSQARLPLESRLVRSARDIPVWVAVTSQAPSSRVGALRQSGCEILQFASDRGVPVLPLLQELGHRQVTNLLVEGGGPALGAFFDTGQVDAVEIYIAPCLAGGSQAHSPIGGRGIARIAEALRIERCEVSLIDGDIRVQGTLTSPPPA